MTQSVTDYRAWLRREFAERASRNARYSLRAFARDVQMLPSRLSDILNGKQGMSAKVARHIAKRLGWSMQECEQFATLVEARHARSRVKRQIAEQETAKFEHKTLDAEVFAVISDWYHFAILELVLTENFKPNVKWISKRLGLTEIEVTQAVDRLVKVGLLRCDGSQWEVVEKFPATQTGIPSTAIKKFHSQILKKAGDALFLQSVDQRDFGAITVAINPQDLPEMKEEIRKFRQAMERKYKSRFGKKQVYAFSLQLFSLTQEEASKEEEKQKINLINRKPLEGVDVP